MNYKRSLFLSHFLRRRARLFFIFTVILACVPIFSLQVGDQAPKFAQPDLSSHYVFSKDLIGKAWLIIDFFATWCVPCKEELPRLEKLADELGNKAMLLIFATDQDPELVQAFFRGRKTATTVLIDRYQVAYKNFGVDSLPTLFLVNTDGRIAFMTSGYTEEAMTELISILKPEKQAE